MAREKKIRNAVKRGEVHRKDKREKAQEKLKRRMEIRKAEKAKEGGAELKAARLAKNVPKTLDNTRIYDSTSYLTANPAELQAAAERAAAASRKVNGEPEPEDEEEEGSDADEEEEDGDDEDELEESDSEEQERIEVDGEDEDEDDDEEDEMPEAGPSRLPTLNATLPSRKAKTDPESGAAAAAAAAQQAAFQQQAGPPPRILITTSPSPCKETYEFCDELSKIFPGGEFFKRPKGKGFELGRIARWSAKRGFGAMIVINEDHKKPNALTLMRLPAGPTAYFRLTSIQSGKSIYGHAKASPHSPELILNNFTTLLGNSVGRLFGSLFPPLPQFRGRQVVTLHNQRDFLFFRRHRYMFSSATSAKLQEIGPRFTLKLRWLRKGLPAVTAQDGRIPGGAGKDHDDGGGDDDDLMQDEDEDESMEEKAAMGEIGKKSATTTARDKEAEMGIPALDEEQEYEWKWKPKMEVSRRTFFL